MADRFDRKRVFLVGLTLFGVASVAGAVAPNAAVLLIARAAQGITSTARQLGSAIGIAMAGGILSWGSGADLAPATHAGRLAIAACGTFVFVAAAAHRSPSSREPDPAAATPPAGPAEWSG